MNRLLYNITINDKGFLGRRTELVTGTLMQRDKGWKVGSYLEREQFDLISAERWEREFTKLGYIVEIRVDAEYYQDAA